VLAAREQTDPARPIEVVDSRTATMTCGLVAIEAARAAAGGAGQAEVLALVHDLLGRTHLAALLNTLEYVQRGGRIGRARALVGTLLNVKPMITVAEGVVTPLEQVRTRQRALSRLVERTTALAERGLERLAVLHAADATSAEMVADQLAGLLPREQIIVGQIGPVIAVYTGPGALAVCAITRR
jgi:DegV family protein with EDD domain